MILHVPESKVPDFNYICHLSVLPISTNASKIIHFMCCSVMCSVMSKMFLFHCFISFTLYLFISCYHSNNHSSWGPHWKTVQNVQISSCSKLQRHICQETNCKQFKTDKVYSVCDRCIKIPNTISSVLADKTSEQKVFILLLRTFHFNLKTVTVCSSLTLSCTSVFFRAVFRWV